MGGGGALQDTAQDEDIWNQILSESSRKVNANSNESHAVIVLGDRNAGKSSLIARVQKEDVSDANKGVALTYSFADVYESENEDPTGRVDFWQLEGEISHRDLLQFGLDEKTISGALVIITLDLSQPWSMVESLKKWLGVLQAHLEGVYSKLDNTDAVNTRKSLEDKLRVYFQTYTEPTATPTDQTASKKKKAYINQNVDLAVFPPLEKNVLLNNLGIPIIVACCKCDSMVALEKDFDYNEGMFEYIQQYLRRICLNYGAALIYTSARKDTNCDLLREYMEHILFGFEFRNRCQLLEKESVFVPAGWDSMQKIALDFDNQKICKDPEEAFENVIKKPNIIKRREQTHATLLSAEDDQEFLQRHKVKIESDTDKKDDTGPTEKGIIRQIEKLGGSILPATANATPITLDDSEDTHPITTKPSLTKAPTETKLPMPSLAAPKAAAEQEAIRGFFASLMGAGKKAPLVAGSAVLRDSAKVESNKVKQSIKK